MGVLSTSDREKTRLALALVLLAWSPAALALDAALEVNQYAHTAWTVRNGALKDPPSAIVQTPDGYLWVGTQFGLLRFDGVRFVRWQPPAGQQLPSINIRGLLVASDGRLWIGTQLGLASLKAGELTVHPEISGNVGGMLEDRDGTIWIGTRYPPPARLCAFGRNGVQCHGDDGAFGQRASSILQDRAGNLWVGAETGLWRWNPGVPKRYPLANFESSRGLLELENGALLIAERGRLAQLAGEDIVAPPPPMDGLRAQFSRLFRDRDGATWVGTFDQGLIHLRQGRLDRFSLADGLSGDYVRDIFEDREGHIWVATDRGLDRFRQLAVTTITQDHGLSVGAPWSVVAAKDGSLWVGTLSGLHRLKDGRITVYRRWSTPGSRRSARRDVTNAGLPHDVIQSLFEDDRQRLWVSTHLGVVYFENGRFVRVSGVPASVHTFAGDTAGNIWISEDRDLFRLVDRRVVERIPWAALGRRTPASVMLAEPVGGGLWLGFRDGTGVAYLEEGRIVASYEAAAGLGRGPIGALHREPDGTLWAATEGGLSRIKDGRAHTLTSEHGLPCEGVNWVIDGADGAYWLYTACGLARVARTEMDAWVAAVEKDRHTQQRVHATVLGNADGVRIHAAPGGFTPQVARSPDGRIWFLPWDGVSVIDPRHLPFNPLPPLVHVEQITVDGTAYGAGPGLRLPPLVRTLSIEYTALSLAAPEETRFRYRLEGQDPDWREVINDRRVQYSNLPPGEYRFRVTASNNSGVWNEEGASLVFTIAPAYYQTAWLQALAVAALLGGLWTAHRIRVRRLARQFHLILEARVAERTRISRDLHDTLLQSSQAALLKFESVLKLLPERAPEARQRLERALDEATEATVEARRAIQGLRRSTTDTTELASFIADIVEDLTAGRVDAPAVHVTVEGISRPLNPIVRDEVHQMAGEALRNAVQHAHARDISVEIDYGERQFRLLVRDDGTGIDEQILRRRANEGHFGLLGMRERADLIGGRLSVWSSAGVGTDVQLTVPAAVAYAAASELSLYRDSVVVRAAGDRMTT